MCHLKCVSNFALFYIFEHLHLCIRISMIKVLQYIPICSQMQIFFHLCMSSCIFEDFFHKKPCNYVCFVKLYFDVALIFIILDFPLNPGNSGTSVSEYVSSLL